MTVYSLREFLSPIVVSSNISQVAANTSLQIDPTQLLNPNRTAMLVDQFRFTCDNMDAVDTAAYYAIARQMFVSIKLGNIALTNGFVPLGLLCPNYDATAVATNAASISGMVPFDNPLVWHLPKPLYVPSNVVMYVDTLRMVPALDTFTTAFGFRVAVAGRSLPANYPIPANIYVPWSTSSYVNGLQGTATSTLAGVTTFVTPDNALGNPNDSALMVTRLLGFHSPISGLTSTAGDIEAGTNGLTVRMTISNGKLLVREPTPFFHLFPQSRRNLDLRAYLRGSNEVPGGEFVRARLDFTQTSSIFFRNFQFTGLGLVGYRSVPCPPGAN